MNTCQPLATVARRLDTSESDLLGFAERRWISCVKKSGAIFLSSRDEYKARFILHLQRLRLTDVEIGTVLEVERPLYSLAQIPKILGRPVRTEPDSTKKERN
jgi:hypothetical protein